MTDSCKPAPTPLAHNQSLPSFAYRNPTCGHCYSELEDEGDGYQCHRCNVWWSYDASDDTPGVFIEEDAEPCGKTDSPEYTPTTFHSNGYDYVPSALAPCLLPEGHTSSCLNPVTYAPTPEGETND